MRAAASSMASGSPSRRRQISATAGGVLLGEGEVGLGRLRPLDEQPHRLVLRSAARAARAGSDRAGRAAARDTRARRAGAAAPGWSRAPSASGTRASRSPRPGAAAKQVLEVVQHQEQLAVAQEVPSGVSTSGRPPSSRTPSALAIVAGTSAGSASGRQVDEVGAIRKVVEQIGGGLQREPRLAHPTRSGQGHQVDIVAAQEVAQLSTLPLPAEQRCRLEGEVVAGGLQASGAAGKSAGRSGCSSWKTRSGSSRSRSRCSPRSRSSVPAGRSSRASCCTVCDSRIWPPWPAARSRDSRLSGAAR